jgi:thiol-disulfide isomerase/thioredoxin
MRNIITFLIFAKVLIFSNIAFSKDFSNFEEQLFPEVTLFDKNDKQINLSLYLKSENNKITILNFWATWCPPCIDELPSLNNLSKDLMADDIDVLAVSMDRGSSSKLIKFLEKNGGENLVFFQDKNWSAGKNIPIKGLPVTLIVKNKDNILKTIYKHLGPLEWDHKDIKRGILNLVNNS